MKAAVRRVLRRLGIELVRYGPRNFIHLRRPLLIADEEIGVVIDVGAGDGSWAQAVRGQDYTGRIVSFEPLPESFAVLRTRLDAAWEAHQVALGADPGRRTLNVSANRKSSSLLPMTPRQIANAPDSAIADSIEVAVARLDDFDLVRDGGRAYLKIDVQGTELEVLRGARKTLPHVRLMEVELSTTILYEGQALVGEAIEAMYADGFELIALQHAFSDAETGDLLQLNGLFRRVRPLS